jgi:hypothetical protein
MAALRLAVPLLITPLQLMTGDSMKTHRDPLIEEVRSARMELSLEFGHDIKKLCAFLRKEERKVLIGCFSAQRQFRRQHERSPTRRALGPGSDCRGAR